MRHTFIAILIAFMLSGCQTISDLPQDQRQVQVVHEIAGKDKAKLYAGIRSWFAKTFRDSKAVLEVQDKEAGQLIGKGIVAKVFPLGFGTYGQCRMVITVDVKDGKYRTTIEPLTLIGNDSPPTERTIYDVEVKDALAAAKRLDDDLAAFVAKGEGTDW